MEDEPDKKEEEKQTKLAILEEKSIQPLNIQYLVVSPAPQRDIALGNVEGLTEFITQNKPSIQMIVWNESEISIFTTNSNIEVKFQPEYHLASSVFFSREEKRRRGYGEDSGVKVWEGEFEPVQFGKRILLKFLDKYSEYFDEDIKEAIKNLKVTSKRIEQTEMLSLDDEIERTVEETEESSNLPRKFTAIMPMFGDYRAELHFEAQVKYKEDDYGHKSKRKIIEVRCVNAREAIQDVMNQVLSNVPEDIPRYYGRMAVRK